MGFALVAGGLPQRAASSRLRKLRATADDRGMISHRSTTPAASSEPDLGTPLASAVTDLGGEPGGAAAAARLLRAYVALNVAALLTAFALGGPAGGSAQAAADAVLAWCRIG